MKTQPTTPMAVYLQDAHPIREGMAIAQYAEAIAANGGSVEIFDYPHSVHAFFNDARPEVYQAENARLAWERTIAFFHACSD